MTLRLHLGPEDLLRTRWAVAPAPLLELGLAVATLKRGGAGFGVWRRTVLDRLPVQARPLLTVVPASGAGPVFLDPVSETLAEGVDCVLRTPSGLVDDELRRVFDTAAVVPPWVRALHDRDRDAWRILRTALVSAHDAIIGPDRERLAAGHRAEIAVRGAVVSQHGLQAALAGAFPGATWSDGVLALPSPSDRDLVVGGRGLTLHPSAFWTGAPLFCDHPDGSLLLVYPSAVPLPVLGRAPTSDALSDLLGRTRAGVLASTRAPRTTNELARDLGASAATASEHARTLRAVGLIDTVRDGQAVRHTISALGTALLAGQQQARQRP